MYRLSKIIPVFMRSTYRADGAQHKATWIQYRGHILAHRITAA